MSSTDNTAPPQPEEEVAQVSATKEEPVEIKEEPVKTEAEPVETEDAPVETEAEPAMETNAEPESDVSEPIKSEAASLETDSSEPAKMETNPDNSEYDATKPSQMEIDGKPPSLVDPDHRKIFVGGLSQKINEESLKEYFGVYGQIEAIRLKTDMFTGNSKGFAFIVFTEQEAVDKVLEKQDHVVLDKKVDVQKGKLKSGKLFVGGITADMTEEDITAHFGQFGKILKTEFPFDKMKNQRKAFCFIVFESDGAVKAITRTIKQTINGKEVDVKKASPPQEQGRGGGFSGRGTGQRFGGQQPDFRSNNINLSGKPFRGGRGGFQGRGGAAGFKAGGRFGGAQKQGFDGSQGYQSYDYTQDQSQGYQAYDYSSYGAQANGQYGYGGQYQYGGQQYGQRYQPY